MKIKTFLEKAGPLAVLALFTLITTTSGTHAQSATGATTPAEQANPVITSQHKEPVFHHLTIDEGLSHNSVFDVIQDRRGFIWATTVQGINRFDGMSFTTFMPQAPGSGPRTPQFYQTILEDRDGILWFCNYGAGLVRHDPVLDTWKYYQHDENNPNSLANNTTWHVFQDRDGILWVSSYGGLSRFDPATEQFTNYHHDPNDPGSLSFDVLSQITQDADGMLWIGTYGGGLEKFDPATGVFTHYRHDPNNPASLSDDRVESVWIDRDGSLWVGTDNGLNHFDPVSGRSVRYFHDENDPASLSHSMILRAQRDSRGDLWVSTWGGGVNRFDGERFIRYQNDPSNPDSLSGGIAPYFSEDRTGALWFGTFGGINVYDPNGQRFARYQHRPDNPNSLPAGRVRAITRDRDGVFWIAMWDQGLVRFDRENNVYTRYRSDPDNPNSLSNDNIFDLRYDPRGWVWVATTAGLNKFDLATETWTQYHADPDNPRGMAGDWISGVAIDAHGDLWLAAYGTGLHRFDPVSETFTRYPADPNNPASLANNNLNYVMVADDGMLWIGGDASVSRFDPATGKAINFTPEQHGLSGLTSDVIYQDRRGTIWVSTYSGVNRFDPDSNRFTSYPDARAVLGDDPRDNLWVIAGKSLARFNPDTGELRRYDEHDGLLSNALEPTAGYVSPSGEIFVGGAKGFNSFFPDQLPDNPTPPPVVLTELELLNRPVEVGADSPLQKHISATRKITLPYDYTALTLRYAALNFRSPEKNQYAYMLAGFDADWIFTDSSSRQATYTNLDPGEYTFRVKASNNDGLWNEEGTTLSLVITPPWWETWWFRSLAGLFMVALIAAGYSYRVRSLRWRTQELEREVALRTRELTESNKQLQASEKRAEESRHVAETANRAKSVFLANMSHELRTPLNGILGYADILRRNTSETGPIANGLDIIRRSGEHLLTLINDILDLAKIEAGKLELYPAPFHLPTFLQQIMGIIHSRAEGKNLSLTYTNLSPLPAVVVADETRLRQVLLNLLGNAVKFTGRGTVTLSVEVLDETQAGKAEVALRFRVEDTGVGIAPEQLGRIFIPFEQTGETGKRAEGTGLGLAISRQIVQEMGGQLQVESELGRGSAFWFDVNLPVTEVAIQEESSLVSTIVGYEGMRRTVLLVDDKLYNRLLLKDLLEPLGFEVRTAEDGQQAVNKALAWRPDAIVMDLMMPVKSGFEAIREMRQRPELKDTFILAVSASVSEADREKSQEAGFDAFLPKPIKTERLLELLAVRLKLTWIYTDAEGEREAPLVAPPIEDLNLLYQLAEEGQVFDIQAQAIRLEKSGEAYAPFARHLQKLAKGYDIEQIEAFIKRFMG